MEHDVFISHSSKNKLLAEAICHVLEEHKIKCWIAPRDVQPGIPYAREIMRGIRECRIMLVVFTKDSNESEHVLNEIDKAVNFNKLILPFIADSTPMNEELNYYLCRKHWLTAFPEPEKYFKNLVKTLCKELNISEAKEEVSSSRAVEDTSILKLEVDSDCRIFVDGEERCVAKADEITRLPLHAGEYKLRFVSLDDEFCYIENNRFTKDNDVEEWYPSKICLLPLTNLKPFKSNGGKWGFINAASGEILISPIYNYAWDFSEGLARVVQNYKYGFIDREGKTIAPCIYKRADDFSEGFAHVKQNNKWGFIDREGKTIAPCIYDSIGFFSEGLARVEQNGKWGYIDREGKTIAPCIYDRADDFSEGLAPVEQNDKWGFIDREGKTMIPCLYDGAWGFSKGLARVVQNGKYGFIDREGKTMIPFIYDDATYFFEGLAGVKHNGKWGFINREGKTIAPCIYDFAWDFSEGLARVEQNGKYGFIDREGKTMIPFIYDLADNFSEGLACVKQNGITFYIDKQGNRKEYN